MRGCWLRLGRWHPELEAKNEDDKHEDAEPEQVARGGIEDVGADRDGHQGADCRQSLGVVVNRVDANHFASGGNGDRYEAFRGGSASGRSVVLGRRPAGVGRAASWGPRRGPAPLSWSLVDAR